MGRILNFKNWRRLNEQTSSEQPDISNIRSKVILVGATPSKTSNSSALAEFKQSDSDLIISGEIDENKALFRKEKLNSTKFWETRTKTQSAKNYLKIGDIVLNGDSGKPVSITIELSDLFSKSVEASGNGIFALGRAMNIRKENSVKGGKVIIGMNAKTTNSFVIDANTAFQNPIGDFRNSAMLTFVTTKLIIPSASNTTQGVAAAKQAAAQGKTSGAEYVNQSAMPKVPSQYWDSLKKISSIDATVFVNKIKGKQIKEYNLELTKYVEEYTNTFFEPFLNAYAERLKGFLKIKADEIGIGSPQFDDLSMYIDEWKTKQNRQKYQEEVEKEIKSLFAAVTTGKTINTPIATASGKTVKGTEGKIGR
jgi:hypothetical protein